MENRTPLFLFPYLCPQIDVYRACLVVVVSYLHSLWLCWAAVVFSQALIYLKDKNSWIIESQAIYNFFPYVHNMNSKHVLLSGLFHFHLGHLLIFRWGSTSFQNGISEDFWSGQDGKTLLVLLLPAVHNSKPWENTSVNQTRTLKVVRGRLAGLGAQDGMNNRAAGCLVSPHLNKKTALIPCFLILNLAADSHRGKLILPYDRMGIPIRPWQRGSIGSLINDKQLGECSLLPCWTCSFPLLPRDTGVAKWKWNERAPSLPLYPYNKWPGLWNAHHPCWVWGFLPLPRNMMMAGWQWQERAHHKKWLSQGSLFVLVAWDSPFPLRVTGASRGHWPEWLCLTSRLPWEACWPETPLLHWETSPGAILEKYLRPPQMAPPVTSGSPSKITLKTFWKCKPPLEPQHLKTLKSTLRPACST